mmetsp:Transcript_12986/g.23433  ORF Transcript_12986/g.23433 Transcript_12986/m.23433 type:complete len:112 (-) Transcript_12986:581-916(-)
MGRRAPDVQHLIDQPMNCPYAGISITAFVVAIVGVALGAAALILSIVNAVRIGRMRKQYESSARSTTSSITTSASSKIRPIETSSKQLEDQCRMECSCCKKLAQIKTIVEE